MYSSCRVHAGHSGFFAQRRQTIVFEVSNGFSSPVDKKCLTSSRVKRSDKFER
ncbi:hypothetical protein BURPS1710A_A2607 [Burkholderia pseudomallei 1710a]|uniref:Uncharacterized protein n=1 Tax=Burkholderia pseudomallei 1710a TaxID=320371 RepID=A0A0E1W412_BURPE|nr:hypothetical protein BURPS1710A_A2607 [Burkholderia pseudomallei 1710a]